MGRTEVGPLEFRGGLIRPCGQPLPTASRSAQQPRSPSASSHSQPHVVRSQPSPRLCPAAPRGARVQGAGGQGALADALLSDN